MLTAKAGMECGGSAGFFCCEAHDKARENYFSHEGCECSCHVKKCEPAKNGRRCETHHLLPLYPDGWCNEGRQLSGARAMKLWVVIDRDRWGHSTNVVRADTKDAAIDSISPKANGVPLRPNLERVEVVELREGEGVLWCDDVSPDTGED